LKKDLLRKGKIVVFIGLNPSIGNLETNDSTLKRIINFCSLWDYKTVYVINLFGLISKSPFEILKNFNPVGKFNDFVTFKLLDFWSENNNCDLWLGWGDKGNYFRRDLEVLELIKNFSNFNLTKKNPSKRLFSLGVTKKGNPRHPLYISKESLLEPFYY
tara:strand:- start:496 stop:972 length:477 start_codon:yes stop_codon:yes gene_type:complete